MIHSFLLIGQSNMSGRGDISEVEPIRSSKLLMLRCGRWRPMVSPVGVDSPYAGICLAESFAKAYSEEYDVEVGLIPCAAGDTNMNMWGKGQLLYDHAVCQARLAQRTSEIKGILWHQGEADCGDDTNTVYEGKCTEMLQNLRADLGLPDVPILLGALGEYLKDYVRNPELFNYPVINAALKRIAQKQPHIGFVSSTGLTPNEDGLHFNAKSLREFGLRFYEEYRRLNVEL